MDFAGEANPVDGARHNDIAENEINLGIVRQQFQRCFGRFSIDRVVTEMLE